MLSVKRFSVYLLLGLVSICVLLIGLSIGFNRTVGSQTEMKNAFQESGLNSDIAKQLQSQVSKQLSDNSSLNVDSSIVDNAASKVITPELVKDNLNPIVDSSYSWLRGEIPEPELRVDTKMVQQQVVLNMVDAVEARVKKLPTCTYQQLLAIDPNNIDLASLRCLPPGLDIAKARQRFVASANSEIVNKIVNQATDGSLIDSQTKPQTFQDIRHLPVIFQILRFVPWVLLVILVLAALLVIKFSPDKQTGLNKLSKRLIFGGISLILIIFFGKYLQGMALDEAGKHLGEVQISAVRVIDILSGTFYKTLLFVGGIALLAGVVGLLVPKFLTPRVKVGK